MIRSDGTFVRDYLHVDDVVDAYLALADGLDRLDIAGEAFNFSDESPRTVLEIYDAMLRRDGRGDVEPAILDARSRRDPGPVPRRVGRARAMLGLEGRYVGSTTGSRDTVDWYRALARRSRAAR